MKANQLKVEFIKWLISKYGNDNIVVGNEVLFSTNKCRADILMLKNNKTYAYEIKSDSDNFIEIEEQLTQYLSTFNYTYLVVTNKHKNQIERISNFNMGIILYTNPGFTLVKKPTLSTQILRENLVEFLPKTELKNLLKIPHYNKLSIFKYRKIVAKKCSKSRIQEQSYFTLFNRYSRLFDLFKHDISKDTILIEDLKTLTGNITSDKLY